MRAESRDPAASSNSASPLAVGGGARSPADRLIEANSQRMLVQGQQIFRFDTFGSEQFWGDQLRLHESVAQLTPRQALELGLKVDADMLPPGLVQQIRRGRVNLDDPAVTHDLLRRRAVLGVTGFFQAGELRSVGIQCAFCHSTVDDSVTAGIGRRLDAWPNRDLDVGKVIASAPNLQPFAGLLGVTEETVRQVLNSWGPGKFDAELILDGKAFRPDGEPAATLIPPAFGLAGVNLHTWTGWGSVPHWNAFVANLEMNGKGTFFDPRLDDADKFPIAAREGFGHKRDVPDLITAKLPPLHFYQLAIPTPRGAPGTFNRAAALRGQALFVNRARCGECHVPPIFTEPGWNMHTPEEIGIDDFQAMRSPDERYRTEPLRALGNPKVHRGGFYHDGRFATLQEVVAHYEALFGLGLTGGEQNDLIEYLKSL